jgi:hypothetical protein
VSPIPENLLRMHAGEDFLRSKSLEAIGHDEHLSRHVALIETVMDTLNLLSLNPAEGEDEDTKTVCLLGMRLFNACGASFRLIVSGYYQIAAMVLRDLLETVFLLGFFKIQPASIKVWRTADEAIRKKEFAPIKVRKALDEKDGFTEKKRAGAYNLLCELAAHPTYKGLVMLAPQAQGYHCGPFFDPTALKALIEELARITVQAGCNYSPFFKGDTKQKMETKLHLMEVGGEWMEMYYGRYFDRREVDEMKAMLVQLQ